MGLETDLLAALIVSLEPIVEAYDHGVVFKHADALTSGIPDMSVTCQKRTTWWEAKVANPRIEGTGLQHLMMRRLAITGTAFYIVYCGSLGNQDRVCIVEPRSIGANGFFTYIHERPGWDHKFVVDFIMSVHVNDWNWTGR